jgi:hypothetical protein
VTEFRFLISWLINDQLGCRRWFGLGTVIECVTHKTAAFHTALIARCMITTGGRTITMVQRKPATIAHSWISNSNSPSVMSVRHLNQLWHHTNAESTNDTKCHDPISSLKLVDYLQCLPLHRRRRSAPASLASYSHRGNTLSYA